MFGTTRFRLTTGAALFAAAIVIALLQLAL